METLTPARTPTAAPTGRPAEPAGVLQLYRDGFVRLDRGAYRYTPELAALAREVDSQPGLFRAEIKDAGSLTLDQQRLPEGVREALIGRFVDSLFDTGLVQAAIRAAGRPLYLTNFVHIVTPPEARELAWHRDTYFRGDQPTGLVPPPLKLMVYHGDVERGSEFQVLAGTHRIDFNSPWLDRALAAVRYRSFQFRGKSGDAVLFDASTVHRRKRPASDRSRSATTFGLVQARFQLEHYRARHAYEIERFEARLRKEGLA